jgi:hypothetical protein
MSGKVVEHKPRIWGCGQQVVMPDERWFVRIVQIGTAVYVSYVKGEANERQS